MTTYSVGTTLTAVIVPALSGQVALENCLHYNPGYEFKQCTVRVWNQTAPVLLRYSDRVVKGAVSVPMYLRLWYTAAPETDLTFTVVETPPTLETVSLSYTPLRQGDHSRVSQDDLEIALDGQILVHDRTIVIQVYGVVYKVVPRVYGGVDFGVYWRGATKVITE